MCIISILSAILCEIVILNWLTFLEAVMDVLGVHFLSGHSVDKLSYNECGTCTDAISKPPPQP